jgi:hypothetical protein
MKNVGIITFHNPINYGAILQTYALQKSIENLNVNCDVIDYINENVEIGGRPKIYFETFKSFLNSLIHYKIKMVKEKKFISFANQYLNISMNSRLNRISLNSINSLYDIFVSGSDQVWNYKITDFDKSYFLDFVVDSKKKCAYAASFGLDSIPNDKSDEYRRLLSDYNFISVREAHGVKIVEELTGRTVDTVLDPTLLLDQHEWNELSDPFSIKIPFSNYILLYTMVATPSILQFSTELANKTKCKIIYLNDSYLKNIKATYYRGAGPIDFLSLFKQARYVVTNSFHGTAFSIIFKKDFYTGMLPSGIGVNSRLENILNTFELQSRQISKNNQTDLSQPINYSIVNELLIREKSKSMKYLKQVLKSADE